MGITTSRSNQTFSYIAFFDLDRTITKAISGRALARKAFGKGIMNKSDLPVAAYFGLAYRLGIVDSAKIMLKMVSWLKNLPEQVLTELCSDIVRETMLPSIHPEAIVEIEMHKSKNAKTVILSTSLPEICKEMAEHLKMDDVICSRLEIRNGYLTGRSEGNLVYGDEKLRQLIEYCEKNNSNPAESWYYADAIIDLPVLSSVGFPVCVNPDKRLRQKAEENRWTIYNWN